VLHHPAAALDYARMVHRERIERARVAREVAAHRRSLRQAAAPRPVAIPTRINGHATEPPRWAGRRAS
jgi:hypothetical protein